ncbi:M20 metallopeptidase family protein [Ruegeria atlantica]|uniref:M20 metallopeptidase family protein n=1 Tax=Ruegeria atlantica TaxID=81569 RepID=UPI00147CD2B9|nr:amidohydrolase [Ruegeria atlantica]
MHSAPDIRISTGVRPREALLKGQKYFTELRHWFHAHPETAYEEVATGQKVAAYLKSWGWEVETGVGKTGIIGRRHFGVGGKSVGFRADMDALPIKENTSLPYESQFAGKMHACGHDGHTAALLATAFALSHADDLNGTVTAIFQPAEEAGDGAEAMFADGLLERYPLHAVFGFHNLPGIAAGKICLREGAFWAAADAIEIRLEGRSSHGAQPHLSRDVIAAVAAIVTSLNTIVSRNMDPADNTSISIGRLHAGSTWNVIPDAAVLQVSIRSFSTESRVLILKRIRQIVSGIATAMDVRSELEVLHGCPAVTNDADLTRLAGDVAVKRFGGRNVEKRAAQLTLSDDFSVFQQHIPGVYIGIGNGLKSQPLHHPQYDFGDTLIKRAAMLWIELAYEFLNRRVTANDNILPNPPRTGRPR